MAFPLSDYHKAKLARTEYYERFIKGWKQRPCGACAGTGYKGSPKCGACEGTGKERYRPSPSDRE
jgi:DnaJ-class molecular chaperone